MERLLALAAERRRCLKMPERLFDLGGMVGLTELESVTSCVSSRRSNQLSYKPIKLESKRSPKSTVALLESKWRPKLTAVNL